MATLSTIPFNFIWDNYFILSYTITPRNHQFQFKTGRMDKEHRDGSIAYNIDNGAFTDNMVRRINSQKERVCNLYEILYDNQMECAFFEKIAKDWILAQETDRWISRMFRTNEDGLAGGGVGENDLLVVQEDNRSPLAQQLVNCRYTLSEENSCHFLARLATQWDNVKTLYRIQSYFGQHNADDVNTMIRSFVGNFVKYKSAYDEIPSILGRNRGDANDLAAILSAFKCRYEYSHGIEPSEKSMLAENFDIDHIGEKFVGVLKQCEILLEYQKIIEGPYSALAEFIKSVRCRIDGDKILFIKEIPEIKDLDNYSKNFLYEMIGIYEKEIDYTNDVVLLKNSDIGCVRNLCSDMVDVLRMYPFSFNPESDLERLFVRKKSLLKNLPLVRYIVQNSGMFEDVNDGLKQVKFKYLYPTGVRFARILLDNPKPHRMHKDDVLAKYNEIARAYGLVEYNDRDFSVTRCDFIESEGKSGFWKLKDMCVTTDNARKGATDLVRDFLATLASVQEFHIDALKKYLKDVNRECPDRSLRTTINGLGYITKEKGKGIYILKDSSSKDKWTIVELIESMATIMASDAKDRTMSKADLKEKLKKLKGKNVNDGTWCNAIKKAPELFSVSKNGRRGELVSLLPDTIENIDFSIYEPEKGSPEYRKAVYQTAIDELLRCKDYTMLLRDLKNIVEKEVPDDIYNNIIYRIFNQEDIFIKSNTEPKYITLNLEVYKKLYADADKSLFDSDKDSKVSKDLENFNYGFDWNILKMEILSHQNEAFLPSLTSAEKNVVLDKMYEIMKGKLQELTSERQFWKTLDLLNRLYLYPTSCYDRELLSTKLILGVENYLSNLLELNGLESGESGLYNKILIAQTSNLLPNRNFSHKINALIGYVISSRNNYSHNNNEKNNGFNAVLINIDRCLKFYIYIAEYICKLEKRI